MTILSHRPVATQTVIDRYDAVRALVDKAMSQGPATHSVEAATLLDCEARWLDARAFDAWLDLYDDDSCLWIPVHPDDHPGRDQALAFDDKRRLRERAWHMSDPQAWAISGPQPLTLRHLGPVAAWAEGQGVLATCTITITHVRRGPPQVLHGRQVCEITAAGLIRMKALLIPELTLGSRHLGWLM